MILNVSRHKSFKLCQRKAFNWHHRGLEAGRSMNLVDGGAFHQGVATGRATKDWARAQEEALALFEEDVKKSSIPEEQLYLIDQHKELVTAMLQCFAEHYEHEVYQIIQPECTFDVELPDSGHNCIFVHWWDKEEKCEKWGTPPAEKILAHAVASPHRSPENCACYGPHRLVGKTDAIVSWNSNIWLDEYKTTSITGQQFWDQWQMDVQLTAYIYGIWKTLGIRPRGVLLNAIQKPSEAQVASWNAKRKTGPPKEAKDYVSFSREAFLRTEEDLYRVERLLLQTAMDWEEQVCSGSDRMITREPFQYNPSSHSCNSYNRKCDYWSCCLNHEAPGEFEALAKRSVDYVDEKYVQITEAKR